MNVAELSRLALDEHGDHDRLVFEGRTWRSSELHGASCRLAAALRDAGVKPGDRVMTILPNRPEALIAFLAIWRCGAVLVPIFPQLTAAEIAARAAHAKPFAVIVTGAIDDRVLGALRAACPIEVVLGVDPESRRGIRPVDRLIGEPGASDDEVAAPGDGLAAIIYTGGTTGRPRGVMLDHRNLLAGVAFQASRERRLVSMFTAPMAHIGGLVWSLGFHVMGDTTILTSSSTPTAVLEAIARHRVQVVQGGPNLLAGLLAIPVVRHDASSVQRWKYAGAPLGDAQRKAFEARFAGRLDGTYGMTETTGQVATTDGMARPAKPGSIGMVAPEPAVPPPRYLAPYRARGLTVRIVGDDGRDAAPGEVGEIWVRGETVTAGYYQLAEETAELLRDGWLVTGDIGQVDGDGELFVRGRKRELIITAGLNVFPRELEDVIESVPCVIECAVVRGTNPLTGEEPVAFATVQGDPARALDEIASACRERLARYKVPRIELVRELPRTAAGKLDRAALERAADQLVARAIDAGELATRMRRATRDQARELAIAAVRDELAHALGAAAVIDLAMPFADLGVDSLHAVQVARRLSGRLAIELSATICFEHATPDALADALVGTILAPGVADAHRGSARAVERDEPIAIIGMSCRFPGEVTDPAGFWRLLCEGRDATCEIPRDRWDADRYYDPNRKPGTMVTKRGGFLAEIDRFDARLFGISPPEADSMDPQHRMVLEACWEAIENAGLSPRGLAGSATGVFVGLGLSEYLFTYAGGLGYGGGTGGSPAMAAGRVARLFDFHGPASVIATACSSALVGFHDACLSLVRGECELALAGGSSAMVSPAQHIVLSEAGALAPDGRCKVFDASANGYARGEGCGIVVLRRLEDALAAGDNVLAVVRATGLNHDGRTSGLTAPSPKAQELLVRTVLARAGLAPADVTYIETHGTGTPLGDPIEVGALARVFGPGRPADRPLYLGSAKANLGHLENAAGVVALIKVVLCLREREIPPNRQLARLNPNIELPGTGIVVPTERVPWRRPPGGRRIAGVSAFSFSGTNAHILLEEPPDACVTRVAAGADDRQPQLLCVSARSAAALGELAARTATHLAAYPSQPLADLCATSRTGRAHFDHRIAIVATTREEMIERLRAQAPASEPARPLPIAFLFTGQGAQRAGMGRELYASQPVFRAALERCAATLDRHLPRPLLDVLFETGPRSIASPTSGGARSIDDTELTQPALFAIEWALAELWRSWGVVPRIVLGHSVGEYVAACVAGVLELDDALRLIAIRGRLMQALPRDGAMAAIAADEDTVRAALAPFARLSIAAINGPRSIVVSGSAAELTALEAALAPAGTRIDRLVVSHAFHSPLMDPMLEPFRGAAAEVRFRPAQLALISNVLGTSPAPGQILDAEYWTRHIREPVRFCDGVRAIESEGPHVFLELGPHPVLLGMAGAFAGPGHRYIASLRRGRPESGRMLEAVGELYAQGAAIDWTGFGGPGRRRAALPTYPFERKRHWLPGRPDVRPTLEPAARSSDHPLLGERIASPLADQLFAAEARAGDGFRDHQVHGAIVFPGAGFVELAWTAAARALGGPIAALEDVAFERALVLADGEPRRLQVVVRPPGDGDRAAIEIHSQVGEGDGEPTWIRHATARVPVETGAAARASSLDELRARIDRAVAVADDYARRARAGVAYGPQFRTVAELWHGADGSGEALGRIRIAPGDEASWDGYVIPPPLLDGCLQVSDAARQTIGRPGAFVFVGVRRLELSTPLRGELWSHARMTPAPDPELWRAELTLFDADGRVVGRADGFESRRVDRAALQRPSTAASVSRLLYEIAWEPAPERPAVPPTAATWLVVGDAGGVTNALADELERVGHRSVASAATDQAALRGLVDRASADPAHLLAGVVWLPAIDERDPARVLGGALQLVQALAARSAELPGGLAFVTRGAHDGAALGGALWGLGRVVASEHPELRCRRIDLPAQLADGDAARALAVELLAAGGDEDELLLRDGKRWVPRLVARATTPPLRKPPGAYALEIETPGVLEGLRLVDRPRADPGPGHVEVEVHHAGLNFRDVMNALGTYPGAQEPLGRECAGVVARIGDGVTGLAIGDRVVVGVVRGALRRFAIADARFVAPLPAGLTGREAVSLPVAHLTALYGLIHLARVRRGERVLIHAGAGGVGLAAIQICQRAGAEVLATAGSPRKRAYLEALGVAHAMDSRSLAFAERVRAATGGRGVDVVLNSLAGAFVPASLGVLAKGGRFVELGKLDVLRPEQVPDGIEYHQFDLGEACNRQDGLWRELYAELCAGLADGTLRPLPIERFAIEDAPAAFRHMAQGRHLGKIVVDVEPPAALRAADPVRADASYLITGGLGGLGLRVAGWLLARGAGHVALVGRRPPSEAARAELAALDAADRMTVIEADVAVRTDVERALAALADRPPLRGVIHAAGVLEDGMLQRQTWDAFARVAAPKLGGAWHLHELTATRRLDFFVLFSSLAAVLGGGGQGAYAAGNAYLDALARMRHGLGLPATSIAWGPWAEVGMAAGPSGSAELLAARGIASLAPEAALAALGHVLTASPAPPVHVVVAQVDWARYAAADSRGRRIVAKLVPTATAAAAEAPATRRSTAGRTAATDLARLPLGERPGALRELLLAQIRTTMGLEAEVSIELDEPLKSHGLDSLMMVELRNRLASALGTSLPSSVLLDHPTVRALTDHLMVRLALDAAPAEREATAPAPISSPAGAPPRDAEQRLASIIAAIEALTDDEQQRLVERLGNPGGPT